MFIHSHLLNDNKEIKAAIKAAKAKKAVKAAKKEKEPEAEAPEDETEASTAAQTFSGADEEEVIDKIFGNYAKESYNAAG